MPEASPIIDFLNLKLITKDIYSLYGNNNYYLAVTGMGKKSLVLKEIVKTLNIKVAINIGIAGAKDKSFPIGSLYITNRELNGFKRASLECAKKAIVSSKELKKDLVDMESCYFLEATKNLDQYIFKIVSDHLSKKIPSKKFVYNIIYQNLETIFKGLD